MTTNGTKQPGSRDDIAWAMEQADRVSAEPSRYLDAEQEARFRERLFRRPTSASGIPLTRKAAQTHG